MAPRAVLVLLLLAADIWGELPALQMPAEPGREEWWTCSLESPN